jgi:hypothetical protein
VAGVLGAGGFFFWKFLQDRRSTETPEAVGETNQKPGTAEEVTVPIIALPKPVAAPEAEQPKAEPRIDLTPDDLKLRTGFRNGKFEITWNANIVKQSGTTVRMDVLLPGGEPKAQNVDLTRSGTHALNITGTGAYVVRVSLAGNEQIENSLSLDAPSSPEVKNPCIAFVDGKPYFQAEVKSAQDLSKYGECHYLLVSGTEIGSVPAERPSAECQSLKILLEKQKPSDIANTSLRICVKTPYCRGQDSKEFKVPLGDVRAGVLKSLEEKNHAGVKHVCGLAEDFKQNDVQELLRLPWFLGSNKETAVELTLLNPDGIKDEQRLVLTSGEDRRGEDSWKTVKERFPAARSWKCSRDRQEAIGYFEVLSPTGWGPVLLFENAGEDRGYESLRMCKLCISIGGAQVAAVQLLKPKAAGPIVLGVGNIETKLPDLKAEGLSLAGAFIANCQKPFVRRVKRPGHSVEAGVGASIDLVPYYQKKDFPGVFSIKSGSTEVCLGVKLESERTGWKFQVTSWWLVSPYIADRKTVFQRYELGKNVIAARSRLKTEQAKAAEKDSGEKIKSAEDAVKTAEGEAVKLSSSKHKMDLEQVLGLYHVINEMQKELRVSEWELGWSVTPPGGQDPAPNDAPWDVIAVVGSKNGQPEVRLEK